GLEQIGGGLKTKIKKISGQLTTIKAMVEVAIDFPDEEAEILNADDLRRQIEPALKGLEDLISAAEHGKIIKDGISAVIIGRPNVGKSSLLNALLREERAIVTSVPGTTRDTVEEYLDILGLPVHIVDTAGIREARGEVEEIGIQRSMAKLTTADLVIMLLDAGSPPHADDERLFAKAAGKPLIIVINKSDIKRPEIIREHYARFPDTAIVTISAKTGDSLPQLEGLIYKTITGDDYSAESRQTIPNLRHQAAMTKALKAGRSFLRGLNNELAPDLMAIDLQTALDYLGEIVGYTTTEDILDKIFGDFCLGK
ncbi:tRNA-5-carboxymethylaminomethyl-2-thiouridine(34)synthesis protein MnmE, partial [hydrothermal vent metagenome]